MELFILADIIIRKSKIHNKLCILKKCIYQMLKFNPYFTGTKMGTIFKCLMLPFILFGSKCLFNSNQLH